MKKIIVVILSLVIYQTVSAQDPQFTQSFNALMYLNPALAGMSNGTRYIMNYRNQWSGIGNGYKTFGASVDINAHAIKSGLGYSIMRDVAGTSRLSFTKNSLYYSHKIQINRKHWINAGISLSHITKGYDLTQLLFADQVIRDGASVTQEMNLLEQTSYQEIGLGLVHYYDNAWTGLSITHINRPADALMEGSQSHVPLKLSIHGGVVLYSKGSYRDPEQLKFYYQYKSQLNWDQLDLGMFYSVRQYTVGALYRGLPFKRLNSNSPNRDAFCVVLKGEFYNGLKIGYSYDFTISKLTNKSGGSHEISLIVEQKSKKKRKRIKTPPCMTF